MKRWPGMSESKTRLQIASLLMCLAPVSVLCQQQRFRVRPSNVSVVEGDSAILRCEVHHQVGQLQWAKDGFALGYSRLLPGYSRYRMVGDPGSGVHDLEVTDVRLDDDGRFQCQVSPNKGQAAIRADALLTVLVKPKSVRTSSTARSSKPGLYEVREGSQLMLKCDVIGARPAASVQWQRNGVDIHPQQEDSFSGWGSPRRNDTTSVVTLRPTAADDGAGYSCVAKHPAIRPAEQRQLNSTVRLSVLYPPGVPEISGYTEGEVVRIGEQKTLTCISRGGNPPAELVWLKNDRLITFKYRKMNRRALAQFTFSVTVEDLNAIYRCEASSLVHPEPMVALAQMNVQFGPEKVTVSGTREVKSGDTVHMTCVTSSSNPPSNITWVINGRTMMNTTQSIEHFPELGWVSSSKVTAAVPAGLAEDMVVSCYAVNPALSLTKAASATVTVLYPPKPPSILGYEPGTYLQAGERVSLSCVSQGGNPPATLTWYSGDVEMASDTEVEDNVARSVITFEVDHKDNGRVYKCDSQNSAGSGVQTATVSLSVYFPPSSLKLEVRPERLRAGSQAILTCESRPSYPAADLTWWRDNAQVTDGVTALETFPAGSQGGYSSRLQLRLNLTWTHDGAVYVCRSQMSELPGGLKLDTMLNVTYPPVFAQTQLVEDIRLGGSRLLNLTASANPGNITYHWYRESSIDDARIVFEGPFLNISGASKEDAGWYQLTALSPEGNSSIRVGLNVQYPPEIVSISNVSIVSSGEEGTVVCRVDANPFTDAMITWHRDLFNFNSSRVTIFSRNGTSYLTIRNVTREDIGEFHCRINNGIGEAAAAARLVVKHEPEFIRKRQFTKTAAEIGGNAHITCQARGAPNVTFRWSKLGVDIGDQEDNKYQLEYTQLDLVTWQSVLKIKDVQASDYATYECVAHNELSSRRQELVLGRPSSPDPPMGLKAVNVSHDAVTLSWYPGFDGGLPQTFRIRYSAVSDKTKFSYAQVQPSNATHFRVEGLASDTAYIFAVKGYNRRGESTYSLAAERRTLGSPPVGYVTDRDDLTKATFPRLTIIIVTMVGAFLLLLNIVFISCYRRCRHKKQKAASNETSTKSETLHMYGTASSMSVKSCRSYTREDSLDSLNDCAVSGGRHSFDPYLGAALIEPPAEYCSRAAAPPRPSMDLGIYVSPTLQPAPAGDEYAAPKQRHLANDQSLSPTRTAPARDEYVSPTSRNAPARDEYVSPSSWTTPVQDEYVPPTSRTVPAPDEYMPSTSRTTPARDEFVSQTPLRVGFLPPTRRGTPDLNEYLSLTHRSAPARGKRLSPARGSPPAGELYVPRTTQCADPGEHYLTPTVRDVPAAEQYVDATQNQFWHLTQHQPVTPVHYPLTPSVPYPPPQGQYPFL
ncbi:nephrin-like isoform X2 [Pollicipes pollicipes]|uniref:nephrin-like isoform X2 n=1 Tax=Pollicipes pollicipes TaxID=41117 RepID=UPI0018851D1E|nr:nephrin-like isoform X2 [Pollicipes pollicipes]